MNTRCILPYFRQTQDHKDRQVTATLIFKGSSDFLTLSTSIHVFPNPATNLSCGDGLWCMAWVYYINSRHHYKMLCITIYIYI